MARAEPGAALTGVGERGGLTVLVVLGWLSLLLALGTAGICALSCSSWNRGGLGGHLFRMPMELQWVSLAGIADPQGLFLLFIALL